jgi:hypothetical protein
MSGPTDIPDDVAELFTAATSSGRPWLRQVLEVQFRQAGTRLPPLLDRWLSELEAGERARRMTGGNGPTFPPSQTVSVSEFAVMTGTTVQAVRARCRRGTLPARRDPDGWVIYLEDMR